MSRKSSLTPTPTSTSPQSPFRLTELSGVAAGGGERFTGKRFPRAALSLLSALAVGMGSVHAQSAADEEEEVFELSPFTVSSDSGGYRVADTLAGARIRTKLVDTPASLEVVTSKFLEDVNATSAEELLNYTTNTEVAGLGGNFSGVAARGFGVGNDAEANRLLNPAGTNRSRGLTAMDNTRNYFQSSIPWDSFNISRIDISRGPNSFLFGVGSPSGISNYSTNDAVFDTFGSVEANYGSFGSTRGVLDYNKQLTDEFAVRLDLVDDNNKYQQKPAYSHARRAYAAVAYDPKFLSTETTYTKIRASFEKGEVRSNNPRTIPPKDFMTGYFDASVNKAGYNPFDFTREGGAPAGYDVDMGPWVTQDDIGLLWSNNPGYWFDANTGSLLRAAQSSTGALKPAGIPGAGNGIGGLNGVGNAYHLHTVGFAHYAKISNFLDPSVYPGAAASTVNYLDKTLSDPEIFDFYNKLIDGPNKREWQNWNSYNVNLVQSFFEEKLVFQAVVQHEDYDRGSNSLTGSPYITVDMDAYLLATPSWLPGAQANPNVGRPITGGTYNGGHKVSFISQDNYQLTGSYALKLDNEPDTLRAKLLGHHEFTGLVGRYTTWQEDRTASLFVTDPAFGQKYTGGALLNNRTINWAAYLGPSLQSGADLSNIANQIVPMSGPVTYFDNTWTAAASVDPTAAWINPMPNGAANMTQADNPANYAGFQPATATILSSGRDIDQLYTDGNKNEQVIDSQALMYQGHFWDNMIIPSIGWRQDKVLQRGNIAPLNLVNGRSMNYELVDEGVEIKTNSTSYGIAVHMPKAIKERWSPGTDLSFYYFHGSNQKPEVRYGIDGTQLPAEQGVTDDFSVQFDGFKGRLTARLTYFKTVDNYAQASYGQPLGAAGWLIDSLPMWTLTMAASGLAAAEVGPANLPADMQGQEWFWGWAVSNPALAADIGEAIKTDFVEMFPQSYWDNYGMGDWVDMEAVARGDWLHTLKNGMSPLTWNVPNTHLVHGVAPIIDQDLVSKGYELDVNLRPFDSWEINFNASKVNAYQSALGESAAAYLTNMGHLWIETPIGLTPEWGGAAIKSEFLNNVWGPYITQIALTGTDQPELREWNFRLVTNYSFLDGALKGMNAGGAYRWASRASGGYGIHEADVFGTPAWLADVSQPYFGPEESHLDLWVGYQRALTDSVDWKVQLNAKNVGESTNLVPVVFEPNGDVAQQRISQGATYNLSVKFIF